MEINSSIRLKWGSKQDAQLLHIWACALRMRWRMWEGSGGVGVHGGQNHHLCHPSLVFFARCFSHPFVPQQHQQQKRRQHKGAHKGEQTCPELLLLLLLGGEECRVWRGASARCERELWFAEAAPPLPSPVDPRPASLPLFHTRTHTHTGRDKSLLLNFKVGRASWAPLHRHPFPPSPPSARSNN